MPFNSTKQLLLNLPRSYKRGLVICFDLCSCIFTTWFAFGLRLDQWSWIQGNQLLPYLFSIAIALPIFISFGLYRAIYRYIGSIALASMAQAFSLYTALFLFIITLIGVDNVPRSVGVIQPILLFVVIGASRYLVRIFLASDNAYQKLLRKTHPIALIYGAGSAGRQLAAGLTNSKEMTVKGFIDDDLRLQGSTINGVPVYSGTDMVALLNRFEISDVLLAIPSAQQSRRNEIITSLFDCGVRVRTLPGLSNLATGRLTFSDLHDLDMSDLLGREAVPPLQGLLDKNIRNKVVLVTGAGGSIGGELCRQALKFSPKLLILIDSSEHNLYLIYEELKRTANNLDGEDLERIAVDQEYSSHPSFPIKLVPCLASVSDKNLLLKIFKVHQPDTVFHAAAYKHVPLVEQNPAEGIRNNVFGTLTCAQVSLECQVSCFILISTDKAVRPTNIMGASKRIAEMVLQAMSDISLKDGHSTIFSMVRFGNVLGSSGSVAPLFSAQISAGGPITLTHPDVTRYFMTIPEAAQLVIQASAMATGGDVFVLDMGEPIRIHDLAIKMIYLSGLLVKNKDNPHGDIEIKVTGLRPGEKLYEELLIGNNPSLTAHPKIMKAHEEFLTWEHLQQDLEKLNLALDSDDLLSIRDMLKKLVPGYQANGNAAA